MIEVSFLGAVGGAMFVWIIGFIVGYFTGRSA